MWKVLLVLVAALAVGLQYSTSQKPGRDFSYGECVAAYEKFGTNSDILEKLQYEERAKEKYRRYSSDELSISLAIVKNKANFHNYLITRQIVRYIGCISHS